jgi:HK97 family phage prohead protease
MGEIVDQGTWDTKSYESNPIILWGHNPNEPENVLGTAVDISTNQSGKSFITAQFDDDATNPKAGLVFRQLVKGTLRCVSAGFIPHTIDTEDDVPVLKDNELLEVSIVPIPANPRALALALKEGSLSTKDAKWLLKSMRDESTAIEAQMKSLEDKEDKNMTDETAKALVDSVKDLTEKFEASTKAFDEFKASTETQLTELATSVKTLTPDDTEETDDEKTAREAKEAEEAEAARKAEEEAADSENPDDPAKGGDDDQPGAGEDEFSDDTELSPEQEAEMDQQLADQLAELEPAA